MACVCKETFSQFLVASAGLMDFSQSATWQLFLAVKVIHL